MPKRQLKAREPVSLAPAFVSQLTSLAVLGIDGRRFREAFGSHPNASRVGKLLLVSLDDAREVLRSKRGARSNDGDDERPADHAPADVDAVLAQLGRRRAG